VRKYGPAGVGFHALLRRLCLRHIGKTTLQYRQQMEELEIEEAFVSQNLLASMLSARILLRYGPAYCPLTSTEEPGVVQTQTKDASTVWQSVSQTTFEVAVRGVRNLRISRLARLRRLVQREHAGLTQLSAADDDDGDGHLVAAAAAATAATATATVTQFSAGLERIVGSSAKQLKAGFVAPARSPSSLVAGSGGGAGRHSSGKKMVNPMFDIDSDDESG
jgi:hypothetical protein